MEKPDERRVGKRTGRLHEHPFPAVVHPAQPGVGREAESSAQDRAEPDGIPVGAGEGCNQRGTGSDGVQNGQNPLYAARPGGYGLIGRYEVGRAVHKGQRATGQENQGTDQKLSGEHEISSLSGWIAGKPSVRRRRAARTGIYGFYSVSCPTHGQPAEDETRRRKRAPPDDPRNRGSRIAGTAAFAPGCFKDRPGSPGRRSAPGLHPRSGRG